MYRRRPKIKNNFPKIERKEKVYHEGGGEARDS
jgi:hypothetical protein